MATGLLGALVVLLVVGASVSTAGHLHPGLNPAHGHYAGHVEGHPSRHVTFSFHGDAVHHLHINGVEHGSFNVLDADDGAPYFHGHLEDGELGGRWISHDQVHGHLEHGHGSQQFNWHAHLLPSAAPSAQTTP
jgi:hypothetical protein